MQELTLELKKAYEETNYKVFFGEKEITLNIGKQSIEMNQILSKLGIDSFVFITAANPYSTPKSISENKKQNQKLANVLSETKTIYCKGSGESLDGQWKEESFCIFGVDKEFGKKMGKKFNQNAFVFGEKDKVPQIIYCI